MAANLTQRVEQDGQVWYNKPADLDLSSIPIGEGFNYNGNTYYNLEHGLKLTSTAPGAPNLSPDSAAPTVNGAYNPLGGTQNPVSLPGSTPAQTTPYNPGNSPTAVPLKPAGTPTPDQNNNATLNGYYTTGPRAGQLVVPGSNPSQSQTPMQGQPQPGVTNNAPINPSTPNPYQYSYSQTATPSPYYNANANYNYGATTTQTPVIAPPKVTLAPGSTDSASVKQLQDYLVSQGLMTQAQVATGPGIYGPQTTAAVAALQAKLGVDNSTGVGFFGPKTLAALTGAMVPPAPYSAPSAIGGGVLGASSQTNYSTPPVSSAAANVMNGASVSAQAQAVKDAEAAKLGPQDTKISDMIAQSLGLNDQEAGKAGYQNQQNSTFGVDEKTKAVTDLQAELQGILNEHTASQITPQQGQGVTTALDNRQRDFETNQSAIKVLRLNSLIAGANSNLTYAKSQADKAVALKFDPIEAQIKANIDNLNLLKNDPKTTAEEKARADAIIMQQDAYKEAVTQARTQATAVQTVAISAASFIANFKPTGQYQTSAQALQAIQNAPDPVTAQLIASQTGLVSPVAKNLPASAQEYEYAKSQGYTGSYLQYQNEDANRKAKAAGSTTTNLTTIDKQGLLGVGFTQSQITQIEADMNAHGMDAVLAGVTDPAQQAAIKKAYGVQASTQFLTKDYLSKLYTSDQLSKAAADAGYKTGGFLGFGQSGDTEAYLTHLTGMIEQYRTAGYTDQDILKMLQ